MSNRRQMAEQWDLWVKTGLQPEASAARPKPQPVEEFTGAAPGVQGNLPLEPNQPLNPKG